MTHAILCVAFTVSFGLIINRDRMIEPSFGEEPFWYKAYYVMMCLNKEVTTLFSGFLFMESFLIASGQSYSISKEKGEDEK